MTKKSELGNRTGQDVKNLEGSWEFLPYNGPELSEELAEAKWPTMNMPSNWFILGNKNKAGRQEFPKKFKIDDAQLPGTGDLAEIDKEEGFNYNGTVYYKKTIDHKPIPGKHTFLDLGMVDYYGEVIVNNKKVPYSKEKDYHEGFFQPWSVDITKALHSGKNQIIVKVTDPQLPVDLSMAYPVAFPKMQNLIKGVLKYHDARPGGVTKKGQECGTGGIIEGIHLRTNDGLEISKIMITPELLSTADGKISKDKAFVNVKYRVENFTDKYKQLLVKNNIKPHNFKKKGQDKSFDKTITVPPGGKDFEQKIKIDKPELWWCRDLGKPNLYSLNIKLCDAENPERIFDSRTNNFGLRKIEKNILDTKDPAKKWGFKLNGENVFIRGSNYLSTQWMSMADEKFYERDVKLMEEANLNAVRVHAKIDREEFYNQADKHGIMVWQDFPLQWGYSDSREFHKEAVKQAGDMAEELYNHPSIIYYCMHNESPHSQGWMAKIDKNQNLKLDEKLVDKVKSIDNTRVIGRDSGSEDGHHYPGWYVPMHGIKEGFNEFSMVTEYGAQGLSSKKLLERILPPEALKLETKSDEAKWIFGNFQPNPNGIVSYTKKHQNSAAIVKDGKVIISRGKNIDDFINNSQTYQAAITKFFTEKQRQLKDKPSTGIFEFQFTDNWAAVATWSKLDNDRTKKKSFFALKEAMQPLLPSIRYNMIDPDAPVGITIINDFHKDLINHTLHWQVGEQKPKSQILKIIKSDGIMDLPDIGSLPAVTKGEAQLKVWITDENDKPIAKNHLCKEHFVPDINKLKK